MNPADLMPQVIRQQCLEFNISNAAILFDDNFVMDHKYKSLLLNVPTRHVIVPTREAGEPLQQQISRLRDLDIVNFFVLGDESTIAAALSAASKLNFTGHKYGWFGISLVQDFSLLCQDCSSMSLMLFKPKQSQNQQQLNELMSKGLLQIPLIMSAFYYDLAKLAVLAMKSALDAGEWRRPRFVDCDDFNENVTVAMRNVDLRRRLRQVSSGSGFSPTYAGFHWGNKNGENHAKFDVDVKLWIVKDSKVVNEDQVAFWEAGIDNKLKVEKASMAASHTAVTSYRVVTVIKPPFVMRDNQTGNWSGYCIDLLNQIRDLVQFEYEIREVEDKEYGNMDEAGNWNGMVRELKDKKADIGLGALAVMAERENVVDYTVPYYDLVGISIMRRKPKAATSLFQFLTVLETDVWLCILGAYFFTSLLMWIFDKFSPYSYQNNREKYKDDEEKREFTLKECLWFCMTSLTPQGGGEAPKNLSGRLVAATWWLFGFIIIASYTANLAAFLTVSRLDAPVESLEDLSKQYKIQYAPIINSSEYRYFERMAAIENRFYEIWKDMSLNDSLSDVERAKLAVWDFPVSDKYTKMFQTMKDTGFPKNLDEALERVRAEDKTEFAFIGDATDIKYLVMTNCEFMQVGDEFSRKPYAIAVQQGSPLKDQFNNAILMMLNKRKLEALKDQWWNKNPLKQQCDKADDQSDGISIQNIGGVFIVIFVGIGLACVTLIFEYYYYRYRPQARQRHQDRSSKTKLAPGITKPMKFNLRPAPTQSFEQIDTTGTSGGGGGGGGGGGVGHRSRY
ncbi:ionotropic receptor 25a [Trichogramma pretiosum]|uniref:ionotropic receptor 25a n=1 Tax=Trichogramma pretiosum TaxID=7493 RepID=UPI000C71A119|nr:ionotropic receptor 25a [Trichogramma pretiosum]